MIVRLFSLILLLPIMVTTLYSKTDDVVELTSSNFNTLVKNSNDVWLVEFYAPWCGHCKNLAPEYKKLAKAMKGIVKIGAVDMTVHQSIGSPYNIKGFPTIKLFGLNKSSPKDYNGQRTANDMMNYLFSELRVIANSRLSGNTNTNTNNNSNNNSKSSNNKDSELLTSATFDAKVINQITHVSFVLFFAPWCGHCKAVMPDWNRLNSSNTDSKIKIYKVDCTAEQSLCQRYQVGGYPTIKAIGPKGVVEDYNSTRDYDTLLSFIKNFRNTHFKKKVEHLFNHEKYETECVKAGNICVIAIIPHILDSSVEERKNYINMLNESLKKNVGMKIAVFWVQGGDNFDLEEKLYLGAGYPTVIALYDPKKKYSVMRGSYTEKNINDFIFDLFHGKAHLNDYKEIPKWKTVEEYKM